MHVLGRNLVYADVLVRENELIIYGANVKLVVVADILLDHVLRAVYKISAASVVIDAYRRVV